MYFPRELLMNFLSTNTNTEIHKIAANSQQLHSIAQFVRVHTALESQGAGLIPARGPNVALFPTIPGLKLYVYTYMLT